MSPRFTLTVDIDAPTLDAAQQLREEIIGAVEDAHERRDPATALVGRVSLAPSVVVLPLTGTGGKLADVELHFDDGPLAGMRLVGFGVFEDNRGRRHVSFPSRQYVMSGQRHVFALLRPLSHPQASAAVDAFILAAFAQWEAQR